MIPTKRIQVTPREIPKILHLPRSLSRAITVLRIIVLNSF